MHATRIRCAVFVLLSSFALAPCQAYGQAAASGPEVINQIFEKTRDATTMAELVEAVTRCEKARSQSLTKEERDYLYRLTAWAYNKRGELYADEAAKLTAPADDRRARELDALALADFEKAVQYDPKRWKALHNRGVSYAMLGKFKESIADFTETLKLNKNYANAWFNRAEIHYEMGSFENAIQDYDQAVLLNPNDAAAITNRGHSQFQVGRVNDAIRDYDEALRLDPQDSDAYTNRGDAFMAMGEWSKAAEDYERAIKLNRDSGRAYQSIAWQMATCPDDHFRAVTDADKQTAVRAAQQALKLEGANADYKFHDTLAAAYANAGLFDDAKTTVAQAIQLAPKNEAVVLRKRYELYDQKQPYRQPLRTAGRPDESKSR